MEFLVIVAILSLAVSLIVVHFDEIKRRTKILNAQYDLNQLSQHIEQLRKDTGMDPAHLSRTPCVQDPEVYLDKCKAGLECTDGEFPGWNGPYVTEVPDDPWGNRYYFDADYLCKSQAPGCGSVPNNTKVRAIVSAGPNGSLDYDKDNVVHIICK